MKAGEFAAKLAIERTRKGLTQEDMATLLGVSLRSYSSWESGKILPHKKNRILIADRLGYAPDYFLTDEELDVKALNSSRTDTDSLNNYSISDSGNVSFRNQAKVDRLLGDLREHLLNTNADEEILLKCIESIEQSLKLNRE